MGREKEEEYSSKGRLGGRYKARIVVLKIERSMENDVNEKVQCRRKEGEIRQRMPPCRRPEVVEGGVGEEQRNRG